MTFIHKLFYSYRYLNQSERKKNVKLRSNLVSSNKIHFDEMLQEIKRIKIIAYLNE